MEVWYVNKDEISTEEEVISLMDRLSIKEKEYASKYLLIEDRKRSVLSFMLQHALVKSHFNVSNSDYVIVRTREVNTGYINVLITKITIEQTICSFEHQILWQLEL